MGDIIYPELGSVMKPAIGAYGASGCNQQKLSDQHILFPLACWQKWPLGTSVEEKEVQIREVAGMQNVNASQLQEHCRRRGRGVEKACEELFEAVHVPIIHDCK